MPGARCNARLRLLNKDSALQIIITWRPARARARALSVPIARIPARNRGMRDQPGMRRKRDWKPVGNSQIDPAEEFSLPPPDPPSLPREIRPLIDRAVIKPDYVDPSRDFFKRAEYPSPRLLKLNSRQEFYPSLGQIELRDDREAGNRALLS